MNAKRPASRRSLKSDLARVDAHAVKLEEYEELPELADEKYRAWPLFPVVRASRSRANGGRARWRGRRFGAGAFRKSPVF